MVLSLPFILAIIGAGVGLLVGILIFGQISEAIECPASGGGGGESGTLIDTLVETSDGSFPIGVNGDKGEWAGQLLSTSGEQITSVTVNNIDIQASQGTLASEIWTGATTDIATSTLVATSDNTLTLTNTIVNFTFTFTPPVTVNDPNTFVALRIGGSWDSTANIQISFTDISPGILLVHDSNTTSGFHAADFGFCFANTCEDMLMQINADNIGGGGEGETGSAECESAKDTAWTVIGIMPVALFFGLFALFSSLSPRP